MQEWSEVAQQPVRGDLDRIQRRVAARRDHPLADDDVPEADHHPPLAGELALQGRHHLLLRGRPGDVERAHAPLGEQEGEGEVVAARGGQGDVGVAADGVDRPVAGGDSGQPGLQLPQRHLVAPVGPLEVAAARVEEANLAADVADRRVGEGLDQMAEGVGRPVAVGVGEGEDLAAGALGGGVLGGDLAAARQVEDEVGAGRPGALDGGVGGAVGGDDQLEPLARVVEREGVGDLGGDHLLLVVGGDDQGDPRQLLPGAGAQGRTAAQPDQRPQGERVAEVGVDDQPGADPEDDREGGHRRASNSSS